MEVEAGGPFVAGNPTKALSRSLTDGSLESGSPSIPSVEFNSLARKEQYEQERKNKALMKAAAKIADAGVGENQDSPKNSFQSLKTRIHLQRLPNRLSNPHRLWPLPQQKGQVRHLGLGLGRMVRMARMVLGMLPIQMNRMLERMVTLRNLTSITSGT